MFNWLRDSWNYALHLFSQVCLSMRIPPVVGLRATATTPQKEQDEVETYKLVYFDVRGLAQATRDTFNFAGIKFEDRRITFDEFKDEFKAKAPYGQVPTLELDGDLTISQSKTILRYVSKKARTYPRNLEYAAIIDQWCDLHTDFMNLLVINMYSERAGLAGTGYDPAIHRSWLLEHHIPRFFDYLEEELKDDQWLGKMDQISMADFCWYPTLCWLRDGTFDGVNVETFSKYPSICRFMDDVSVQLSENEDTDDEEEGEDEEEAEEDFESDEYADVDKKKDE